MTDPIFDATRPTTRGAIFETVSRERESNPKDLLGARKLSISKLPLVALLHAADAMGDGQKYGPYNWREKKVLASIYVDACLRHLGAWFEREEAAPDSGVHHLGHAIASLAILLDAQESGCLVDDRPSGGRFAAVLARLNAKKAASQSSVPRGKDGGPK